MFSLQLPFSTIPIFTNVIRYNCEIVERAGACHFDKFGSCNFQFALRKRATHARVAERQFQRRDAPRLFRVGRLRYRKSTHGALNRRIKGD